MLLSGSPPSLLRCLLDAAVNNSQKTISVWAANTGAKDMSIDQLMKEMSKTPQIVFIKERLSMKLDDDGK
jgi:hypothetical protein